MESSAGASSRSAAPVVTAPMRSSVKEAFWERLSELKIDALHTDERPLPIVGYYAPCKNRISEVLTLDSKSLSCALDEQAPALGTVRGNRNQCPVPGTLLNTNTLQSFNALNKESLLANEALKIWEDIKSKRVEEEPARLLRFLVISYADLKKWEFHYWVAFPTLLLKTPASLVSLQMASKFFSADEAAYLLNACNEWRNSSHTADIPFFLVSITNSHVFLRPLQDLESCYNQGDGEKLLLGFYDPCHLSKCPGWPVQNLLAFLSLRSKTERVHLFCYRENRRGLDLDLSLVIEALVSKTNAQPDPDIFLKSVGWEKHDGVLKSKVAKLESSMQFDRRATAAAELNIKLMTWRSLPSLKLGVLSSIRCLILGVGILGCEVARCLMAWGVRKITLVDNRTVAKEDLEHESLYSIDDCEGSQNKAIAAARELKRIFSAVEAEGIDLNLPMFGHCGEVDDVVRDCERLQSLVASHDALFLLTGTSGSRWLPTLISASENKVVLSAVSGVDNYIVIRHGAGPLQLGSHSSEDSLVTEMDKLCKEDVSGRQLACYFCSESCSSFDKLVVRPGAARIASALIVELFVGVLHHPRGIHAPGEISNSILGSIDNPFGILPHQIQGSVSQCTMSTSTCYSSSSCVACSSAVVSEYRKRGMAFIKEAICNPEYLNDRRNIAISPSLRASNSHDLSCVRCLLVGAGTLGCNVARILIARGARKITLIDSGMVSLSNPVRQSLYTLDDCRGKGVRKASAAAKKLRSICADVESEDIIMAIPMPGHPISDEEEASVLESCERLQELISSHDAVFLLTDTRESRWLPSLLCAAENKIAVTAALGFDSFLVMRHGAGPFTRIQDVDTEAGHSLEDSGNQQKRLGCYFCNDVVAPIDSISNRTLDQQCTVSRPALSLISSDLAVDLLCRVLHHPQGLSAPVGSSTRDARILSPGALPHQIRGSLPHYALMTLTGHASSSCTACSDAVVLEFRRRGKEFLKDAINHPTYLEDLTGLTDLMKSASSFQLDWSSDNDLCGDGDDDDDDFPI